MVRPRAHGGSGHPRSIPSPASARSRCRRNSPASEDGSRPGSQHHHLAAGADITASLGTRRFTKRARSSPSERYAGSGREAHPDHPVLQLLPASRRLGGVRGAAGRREGLYSGTGNAVAGSRRELARGTLGRRHRHPHQGLDRPAGGGFLAAHSTLAVGRRGRVDRYTRFFFFFFYCAGASHGVHAGSIAIRAIRRDPEKRLGSRCDIREIPRRGARQQETITLRCGRGG